MRNLLVGLVLLNLVFFGYTRLIDTPPVRPAVESGSAVPRLALANEIKRPTGGRCESVGPFSEQAGAHEAGQWVIETHHEARERSVEADGQPSYQVALTVSTLQTATRIATRLKTEGVGDVEIVPPGAGESRAALSLGTFADRPHAETRVAAMKRHGLAAVIVEQPHRVNQWWLDVRLSASDPPLDVAALKAAFRGVGAAILVLGPCAAPSPTPATPGPAGPPESPAIPPKESAAAPGTAKLPEKPA